jgi:hypothetical protein
MPQATREWPDPPDLKPYNDDIEAARNEVFALKSELRITEKLAPEEAPSVRLRYKDALERYAYLERTRQQILQEWIREELAELAAKA